METEKKYTVIELAALIGVPRTTINDWLSRYAQYIISVAQGKRKVYPESALAVLREIAEMRNAGKAFSDIETELGQRHPIKAEPVPPSAEMKTESKTAETGDAAEAVPTHLASSTEGEFAVIARRQSEELGRIIGDSFRNMNQRIQELENLSRTQRKMTAIWFTAFIIFLLLLAAGGFTAWHFIEHAKSENAVLVRQQMDSVKKIAVLNEQTVTLIAGNKSFQENVKRLERDLKEQKQTFDRSLTAERKRLEELYKAREKNLVSEREKKELQLKESELRLTLEKERFAAERLKMAKELEAAKTELAKQKKAAEKSAKAPQKAVKASSKGNAAAKAAAAPAP